MNLGAVDAEFREQMSLELKKLHERIEATTIYVTDQIEAMTMGDKIAVMDQGKVLQYGTPDEIYSRPATKFVGSFIGSGNEFYPHRISDSSRGHRSSGWRSKNGNS